MAFAGALDPDTLPATLRSSFGTSTEIDAPKAGQDLIGVLDRLLDLSENARKLRG